MKLTNDQTKKVATLASLPIDDGDLDIYSSQLSKILDYIDQLGKVDVLDTEPLYNVSTNQSVMREDEVRRSLHQDEVLKNASNVKDGQPAGRQGYFITKGVFNEE